MAVSRAVTDGILRRLAKSQAGNALALVAAGLIPLIGLIGGGVDMSRIYLTKARLQQACDAGALTGRKTMGASSWSASNYAARTAANTMFAANFKTGAYGTSGLTNSYSESSGKVTGTASVVLPMSLMKIFGQSTKTITVNCDAEMRIPNTDVMFVLDTTGSMGDTNVGDTDTKMNGLKKAVKCFYEALAKIDTAADCGSVPTTSNSSTVQLRFGFMPYATDVNVGKLLKNDWIADSWPYQTRVANFTTTTTPGATTQGTATVTSDTFGSYGSWSSQSLYGYYNGYCGGYWNTTTSSGGSEGAAYNQQSTTSGNTTTVTWSTNTTVTQYEYTESNYTYGGNRYCLVYVRNRSAVETKQYSRTDTTSAPTTSTAFSDWTYDQHSWDISSLKAGNDTWNSSVSLPVGTNGASKSISWDGCIEERQTVRTTDFSPIPTDAYDLDIDKIPTTSDPATQWGPALPNAVWGRYNNGGNNQYSALTTSNDLYPNIYYSCPVQAKKLQAWPTASAFETYVDSLTPSGNTYHDIGLIWGARFISPTGLFSSENAFTANGGTIERHIVFMTDGDTVTSNQYYQAYGVAWWDRRQTASSASPANDKLTEQVNLRFSAMCTAIKNKNITLWVVSFGSGVNTDSIARLQACASPGKFFTSANNTELLNSFKSIADQISQLRLTG